MTLGPLPLRGPVGVITGGIRRDLQAWAQWIGDQTKAGRTVFNYFDNEVKSAAPQDADKLVALLK